MPMLRGSALRSFQSTLRHSSARVTARAAHPARTQLIAKRFASGGGDHGHGQPSSDIPWLIGALVVTPPAMWYLWPAAHDDHHHEEHGHDEHAGEEDEEKPSEEESPPEDEAPQEETAASEQSDDSQQDSGDEEKKGDKKGEEGKQGGGDEQASGDEGDDQPESEGEDSEKETGSSGRKAGKGHMAADSDGHNETRKTEPRPSKGSNVKRVDSGLGKNLGQGPTHDEDDPKKESAATSKEVSSDLGDISNKQKGLNSTDARHSVQIDADPEKSKKGTGHPETAKAQGTIDPKAPVR